MEKPMKKKLLVTHFSHEHLLEHTKLLPPKCSVCYGCKIELLPGKRYYKCKTCPFFLHQVCYEMPQQVQHQIDPNHQMILLSIPSSSVESFIECNACKTNIVNGFYYNCPRCGNFYHSLCLASPLSVKLPLHSHTLNLEFSPPPYDFQCDLCDRPSNYYRGWLYRCGLCEFDAHISCALIDTQSKEGNELIELLSRKLMKGQVKLNDQDEEEIPIIEDIATPSFTPSYQLSDACFSIDLSKSLVNDDQKFKVVRQIGYVVVPKGLMMHANPTFDPSETPSSSFALHSKSSKKGQEDLAISTAIGSHVYGEIVQENVMNNVKALNAAASEESKQSNSVRSRCWCW